MGIEEDDAELAREIAEEEAKLTPEEVTAVRARADKFERDLDAAIRKGMEKDAIRKAAGIPEPPDDLPEYVPLPGENGTLAFIVPRQPKPRTR